MKLVKLLLFFILTVILVIFALSNRQYAAIDLFPFGFELNLPLFLVMFVCFIIGLIIGGMSSFLYNLRLRYRSRIARKHSEKMEQELIKMKRGMLG